MEILIIFFGIIVFVIVIVMVKYYTDPKMRKASNILIEYEEKKKRGEVIFSETDGFIDLTRPTNNDDEYNSPTIEDLLFDLEEYTDSDESLELPIRGINFRNLNENNIGSFDGYIAPDKENKHDKYAIGVYSEDGTHFGFIEKNQPNLYKLIESGEGYINATLEVHTFIDDMGKSKLHGTVTINKDDLI